MTDRRHQAQTVPRDAASATRPMTMERLGTMEKISEDLMMLLISSRLMPISSARLRARSRYATENAVM